MSFTPCFFITFLLISSASFSYQKTYKKAIAIKDSADYEARLAAAGDKLVVIGFLASWCKHSQTAVSNIEELARELGDSVVFLTVDVEECEDLATEYDVHTYPKFFFIRNYKVLDSLRGSNFDKLKESVRKYQGPSNYFHKKQCNKNKVIPIKNAADLESRLAKAGDKLVVIGFMASWCKHSQTAAPNVEKLARALRDSVIFVTVDIDKCKDIAAKYDVHHYPRFFLVKNFEQLEIVRGSNFDKLKGAVRRHM